MKKWKLFQELSFPEDVNKIIQLQAAIRFNGGGHLNHSIFWETLSPKGGGEPQDGALKDLILEEFVTFDALKKALTDASVGVQGSGWGWLGYDKAAHSLRVVTCANQDPLLATTGETQLHMFIYLFVPFSWL